MAKYELPFTRIFWRAAVLHLRLRFGKYRPLVKITWKSDYKKRRKNSNKITTRFLKKTAMNVK
jgi:hypothetical protein